MSARSREASVAALLARAGWRRDAVAAAFSSARRDAAASAATVQAIEAAFERALGASRTAAAPALDPGSLLRDVGRLAMIERSRAVASRQLAESTAIVARRRDECQAAQARVDALERRRDAERQAARADAERRAGNEIDHHWLATLRPADDAEASP